VFLCVIQLVSCLLVTRSSQLVQLLCVSSGHRPTHILDAVPPVHVISNHIDTDKLTTANGRMFASSSASLNSQSR